MANETINQVVDQKVWDELEHRLPDDLDAVAKKMAEVSKQFKNNPLSFSLSSNLKEEINRIRQLVEMQGKLKQAFSDTNKAEQAAARTRRDTAKAIQEEEKAARQKIQTLQAEQRQQQAQTRAEQAAERQRQRTTQVQNVAHDSLQAMSIALENHRRGYQRLTEAERNNAEIGGVVLARIQELDKALKAADASQGKYNRNVGNYKSGFNGLSNSIQQIIREGPSAAISMNTFFLAISNNLPILFDEIAKLKATQKEMKAAGKAAYDAALQKALDAQKTEAQAKAEAKLAAALAVATPEELEAAAAARLKAEASLKAAGATEAEAKAAGDLAATQALVNAQAERSPRLWAQIARSVLSLNTLLTVGVIALTLFGGKIIDFFKGATGASAEAEKANKKYAESIKSIEENSRDSAQQDISRINILTSLAKSESQSHRTRMRAIKELQETYPATFGALKEQAILEGKLGDAVDVTTKALIQRATYQAAEKKFAAAGEKVYDLTLAQRKATDELRVAEAQLNSTREGSDAEERGLNEFNIIDKIGRTRASLVKIEKDIAEAQREQNQYLIDAQTAAAAAGDALFGKDPKDTVKAVKDESDQILAARKQYTEAERDLQLYRLQQTIDTNNAILDNEKETALNRATAFAAIYNAQIETARLNRDKELADIVSWEALYTSKVRIAENTRISLRTEAQIKLLIEYETMLIRRMAIDEKYAAEINKIDAGVYSFVAKLATDTDRLRQQTGEDGIKAAARFAKQMQDIEEQRNKNAKAKSKERIKINRDEQEAIFSIASDFVNTLSNLTSIQAQKERDIAEAKKSQLDVDTEIEISKIKAKGLSEEETNKQIAAAEAARDIAKREADRDQAVRNERLAKQQKEIAILNIILNTAQAVIKAFTEGDPYTKTLRAIAAGAAGAAQLAVAIATPLPHYAEGTGANKHKGGPAIVGDGGEHEWIKEPGKKGYWSPDSSTILNLASGTTVTPPDKLAAMAHYDAVRVLGFGIVTPDRYAGVLVDSFERMTNEMRGVKRSIDKKATIIMHGTDRGISAIGKQSNAWTKYLNKNIRA